MRALMGSVHIGPTGFPERLSAGDTQQFDLLAGGLSFDVDMMKLSRAVDGSEPATAKQAAVRVAWSITSPAVFTAGRVSEMHWVAELASGDGGGLS